MMNHNNQILPFKTLCFINELLLLLLLFVEMELELQFFHSTWST
jgi:hypothetical protein